jgi:hypothetical protein
VVLATSQSVSVDKTLQQVTWNGLSDLSAFANQPVQFQFTLTNGELYSFWVSASTSGASNGYVAANGPGFTGPTDNLGVGSYPTTVATPEIYPVGGTISSSTSVTILTRTVGSTIYYTLDGSTPTASSLVYSGPLTLAASATVNAIAMASGLQTSAMDSATFIVSNTPPMVSITSPTNGQFVSAALSLTASASDSVGVANVQFLVDGAPFGTVSAAPYTMSLQTTTLTNATHTITAVATDNVGNQATSAAVTVAVDNVTTGATAGLVAYWSFDSTYVNGTTLFDQSGNMNNATAFSTTSVPGEIGQALYFNGSSSSIQVPSSLSTQAFDLVGDLSFSLWVQTANSTRDEALISKYTAAGSGFGYVLRTTPAGTVELQLGNNNVAASTISVATDVTRINDGNWHYVAVVVALGSSVTFYVDGQLSSTYPMDSVSSVAGTSFEMGITSIATSGTYFTGSMDEVRVYNRTLSASDVASLFHNAPSILLTIAKTHIGNFEQGQQNASYSVTVSNAPSAGATIGPVTVTETVPSGMTLASMTGIGWACSANSCTRSDALNGGASYPAITVTVNVASNATSPQVNQVTVSGGGSATASVNDSTVIVPIPLLTIAKTHIGNFEQGQQSAGYTIAVSNAPSAGPTIGPVTVAESIPAGLSLVSMAGSGWVCSANSCTRSDALNGGASYPAITVTVNVAANAASPQVNQVTVSGGGSATASVNDSTVIVPSPLLTITKTHTGSFQQAQQNASYTVTVSNAPSAGPTIGPVTVAETIPAGLTLVSMTGSGWVCSANSCMRSDALNGGASYPAITVTVNVAANANSPQVNQVTVSGGGSATASVNDSTTITAPALISIAVTPGNPTAETGATQQFTALGTYTGNTTQNITSQVAWTSSNTSVATIDSSGLATIVGLGMTTVSATQNGVSGSATLTAQAPPPTCPCMIWSSNATPTVVDAGAGPGVELGVKFTSASSGIITGIRFYKSSANTGTHVGNLWTSTGTLLATATFSNETASGWQQVNFSSGVPITANTVYVASYYSSVGHFSADQGFFATAGVSNPPLQALANAAGGNGLYVYGSGGIFPNSSYNSTNYWVDVVFSTTVVSTSVPNVVGDTQAAASAAITGAGLAVGTVTTASSPTVPSGEVISENPGAGTSAVSGSAVNLVVSTGQAGGCPCTIWSSNAIPTTVDGGPDSPVELGVKFTSSTSGTITGIRFYKSSANTGPHVGNLWSSTGALLATATFSNETASGWQQVSFSAAVAINANTTYVASYHTIVGHYSADQGFFAAGGITNSPLQALSNGAAGGNGVYAYGAGGIFPGNSYNSTNYWVDVVFTQAAPPTCPCTIWSSNAVPTTVDGGPDSPVELGVKFTSSTSGTITGIRFYKSSANTGLHVGNLWSSTGALLATATFSNETASGWQQVTFSPAIAIIANATYVASYHTTVGHYSADQGFFAAGGITDSPLQALSNGAAGGNGVYAYGSASSFPGNTYNSTNYWVDVVFQ